MTLPWYRSICNVIIEMFIEYKQHYKLWLIMKGGNFMATMREYLAVLTLFESNFRVLHWKLAGKEWHNSHERFGGYYDQMGEFMDQTAEQMLSMGENPLHDKQAYELLESSSDDFKVVDPSADYSAKDANIFAKYMFSTLLGMTSQLATDQSLPPEVADVFMDHARWYRIEGEYKLARAITKPDD